MREKRKKKKVLIQYFELLKLDGWVFWSNDWFGWTRVARVQLEIRIWIKLSWRKNNVILFLEKSVPKLNIQECLISPLLSFTNYVVILLRIDKHIQHYIV